MATILKHVREQAQKMADLDKDAWVVLYDRLDPICPYVYANKEYAQSHDFWSALEIVCALYPNEV